MPLPPDPPSPASPPVPRVRWGPTDVWPPPVARLIPPPPRKPLWTHPGLLAALLGSAFILMLILAVGLGAVQVLSKDRQILQPGMFFIEVVAFLVPAVVYALATRVRWEGSFGFTWRAAIGLLLGVPAAAGVWVLGTSLVGWFLRLLPLDLVEQAARQIEPMFRCETPAQWTWTILALVVVAPVAEEIMFRGLFQRGLQHRLRPTPALLISSLVFAAIHVQVLTFPVLFVLGLEFGWLYQRTGSLWPGIVAHAVNNLLALVAYNLGGTTDRLVDVEGWLLLLGGSVVVTAGALLLFGWITRRKPAAPVVVSPSPTAGRPPVSPGSPPPV